MFGQIITLLSIIACIGLNTPFEVEKTIKYDEVVTTESINQRNCQHTDWLNSFTEVTYKYETNEVNSIDDLVEGNIYKFSIDNLASSSTTFMFDASVVYAYRLGFYIDLDVDGYLHLAEVYNANGNFMQVSIFINNSYVSNYSLDNVYYFVYKRSFNADYIQYVSASDYNEIESVTYHEPQTVIGVINEFCENYLFSEIPFASSMTFEIGGQNVNLLTWLVMLVGIALSIGILILLFMVFKWLFLLFAGIFKR